VSIQSLRDIIRDHDHGIVRGLASIDNLEENILDCAPDRRRGADVNGTCYACANPLGEQWVWLKVQDTGTTSGTGWRPFCLHCAYLNRPAKYTLTYNPEWTGCIEYLVDAKERRGGEA